VAARQFFHYAFHPGNNLTFSCVVEQKSFLFNSISLSKIIPSFGSDSVIKNGAVLDLDQ